MPLHHAEPPVPLASRAALVAVAVLACACRSSAPKDSAGSQGAELSSAVALAVDAAEPPPPPADAPKLGVIGLKAIVHERAAGVSRKLGYLTLGATVARGESPAGNEGCAGGWYSVHPRGFVCVGENVTLDLQNPLLDAARVRPDVTQPLPYKYGFVRAISPLYLRVPTTQEQLASEFGLDKHMEWWRAEGVESNKVAGSSLGEGALFGGAGDDDPPPFWLKGGARGIPNVASFKVPKDSYFANRVRRHAGLAFVGSFPTGADSLGRRFAVTTDLRLVPTSKVKPDPGSAFHGVEIAGDVAVPFAFVRVKGAFAFKVGAAGKPQKTEQALAYRSVVRLSGKTFAKGKTTYRETVDGKWLSAADAGFVLAPTDYPPAANAGQKWIEISIENQTLVMWEGKKPIYATLVSTGQDGMNDPKTSKSTVRGTFHIRHKHVTTTMDSNGKSSEGGDSATEREVHAKERDGAGGGGATESKAKKGQGTFELRDVPYVQYFEHNYALHAAYWHDAFGLPRSHGCVNLAPVDAHRLFGWTEPRVPAGWHAAIVGPDVGTTVVIHK